VPRCRSTAFTPARRGGLLGLVNTLIGAHRAAHAAATVLTLGLFIFVINGLLFWFVASFVKGFSVEGFWSAFFGAIVYALVSWAASALVFGRRASSWCARRARP